MRLRYEPYSEPLHMSAKQLFLNLQVKDSPAEAQYLGTLQGYLAHKKTPTPLGTP